MRQLEGNLLTPEGWQLGRLKWRNGVIEAMEGEPVDPDANEAPRLIPGFIDLHVHGGGGADVMEGGEAAATLARTHARFGTTSVLATTMTDSRAAIEQALRGVQRVMLEPPEQAADIMGVHLEGPFISDRRLGAQPPYARPGTREELEALMALVPIRAITLAPELDGHEGLIDWLNRQGIRVQIGHSDGDYETAIMALGQGAHGFTHLYNAMRGLHHRDPGIVGAALAQASFAEIIPDLVHVAPGAVLAALRAIPGLYGITDATAAAGMPEGQYRLGENDVYKRGDSVRLADGTLAGSALTMDVALRNWMALGLPLAEASRRLSLLPARYLGLTDRGALAPGQRADIVTLDHAMNLQAVHVAGRAIESVATIPHDSDPSP
ncbi:N-acetylglucosamine-6-phosphate deacetylase [Kushneria phosphatilytica]|uniref:N-acetylglucosamine-6-phosphate deacetylase n=1 Tax=Kushneria phosphatilytica TaxID=657387 RepID=A0A1S1NYL2_9GAMM|nr:N-acetylglucosamine-6-phosphate deacetylase [Kushneria phosphatilytica]OHV12863.1 N-acetylglucosamine-6-phosphate deacetylase [Kushneria phosphatilytica]QEL10722.1 N-acetylglucosamine-6-phosphate deacetylase [Kushneria phosphatilytica]